jgi:hypothetical protein
MNPQQLTRCDGLPFEARAQRLAMNMFHLGHGEVRLKDAYVSKKRVPGICGVCGNATAVTWRAVKWTDDGTELGKFDMRESGHEPEVLAKVEAFLKVEPDGMGLRAGYLMAPVAACSSLDEKCWARAKQIVAEKAASVVAAAKDNGNDNRSDRAKRAAWSQKSDF